MAGPGDILGGLAQIGAIGAHGAYGGDIEGRVLKSNLQAQEAENQLRMLRLLQQQAMGNQPIGFGPGTMVFDPKTNQWNQVPFAPRSPVNLGPGHTALDPVSGRPIYTAPTAPAKPALPPPHYTTDAQGNVTAIIPRFDESGQLDLKTQTLRGVGPTAKETGAARVPAPHYVTDAQGNVRVITPQIGEGGKIDYNTSLLGQYGKPVAPGAGPGGVKETVETTTRITPRKPITGDSANFKALQQALPDVVKELSAKPGFNVPGPFVTLPNGMRVRKEEIIAQAMLNKFDAEVQVRWVPAPSYFNKDAGAFTVVKAWEPTQREPVEKRRTVGPPQQRAEPEAEEE